MDSSLILFLSPKAWMGIFKIVICIHKSTSLISYYFDGLNMILAIIVRLEDTVNALMKFFIILPLIFEKNSDILLKNKKNKKAYDTSSAKHVNLITELLQPD